MTLRIAWTWALLLIAAFCMSGCCHSHRATTRPSDEAIKDYIVGPEDYQQAVYTQASTRTAATPHRILVLSGGGSNGAWGAGFLKGWGEAGTRPQFDIVTGVSTGALMSTAAFLGDAELLDIYTHISNQDIQSPHNKLFAILFSNALNSTAPLKASLKKYVTNEKIDRIANDADRRKLFVASVNLDSGKLVIWDLTAIAKAARAETHEPEKSQKYDFFREVMRASAAAPALYPPVNLNGSLHCDGGVRASLFIDKYFVPAIKGGSQGGQGDLYAINNGKIGMADQVTQDCIVPIGSRAVACLLNQNGVDSVLRARLAAHDAKYNFHLSYIPDDVDELPSFEFDSKEMTRLFEAGEARGKQEAGRWADEDINPKLQRVFQQKQSK